MFVVVLAFIIIATILAVIGTGFGIFSYCKKKEFGLKVSIVCWVTSIVFLGFAIYYAFASVIQQKGGKMVDVCLIFIIITIVAFGVAIISYAVYYFKNLIVAYAICFASIIVIIVSFLVAVGIYALFL